MSGAFGGAAQPRGNALVPQRSRSRSRATFLATLATAVVGALFGLGLFAVAGPEAVGSLSSAKRVSSAKPRPLSPSLQELVSRTLGRASKRYWITPATLRGVSAGMSLRFGDSAVSLSTPLGSAGLSLARLVRGELSDAVGDTAPTAVRNQVFYRQPELSQWYANGPAGLEQGFTLSQRPLAGGAGPLVLELHVSGLRVTSGNGDLVLRDRSGAAALYYGDLRVTDRAGRNVPAELAPTRDGIAIRIDDRNASYPLHVDPFAQVAEFTEASGHANDLFGSSIAMAGNGLVVGAPGVNSGEGAVFGLSEPVNGYGNASPGSEVTPADGSAGEHFGASVAVQGSTLVVGAPNLAQGAGHSDQGAAFVYTESSDGWGAPPTYDGMLFDASGAAGDEFGSSVAVYGNTIVVGVPGASVSGQAGAGTADVFVEPAGGWTEMGLPTAKLTSSTPAAGQALGYSVAIWGNTVVAGVPYATVDQELDAGEVGLFVEPTGGWKSETQATWLQESGTLVATSSCQYQSNCPAPEVGTAVAMSGNTIVAGAPQIFSDGYPGSGYVFYRPDESPPFAPVTVSSAHLEAQTTDECLTGDSVAIDGGLIALGAPTCSGGTVNGGNDPVNGAHGQTFVYLEPRSGWADGDPTEVIQPSDVVVGDGFGTGVGVSGQDVAGGSPDHEVGANSDQGAAYMFQEPGPVAQTLSATSVTGSSAVLNAVVDPEGENVTDCHFDWGTSIQYSSNATCAQSPGSGDGGILIQTPISNLSPGTTYHFRVTATTSAGYDLGADLSFTTPSPPTATTGLATNVTQTSATVAGTIDPEGSPTSCEFQYGTTLGFGSTASCNVSPGSGTTAVSVSGSLTNLALGAGYYYRIVATNATGTTFGATQTFTTEGLPNGPPGSGPAVKAPNTKPLSSTSCTNVTELITVPNGQFQVTGCVAGDNEGQYIVQGTFTLNGLTVTPAGTAGSGGTGPSFSCQPTDSSCNSLLTMYNSSGKPSFIIDTSNYSIAGNTKYTLSTGSTTLYDGALESPGGATPELPGATFNPTASGQEADSPPAIELKPSGADSTLDLHGLPIEGPVTIFPQGTTGSAIQLNLKVPFAGLSGQATLQVSPTGSENLSQLKLTINDLAIPGTGIDLGKVSFSFNLVDDSWTALATLKVPDLDVSFELQIEIKDGNFNGAEGGADGLDVPVPGTDGLVEIDSIGGGFTISPAEIEGDIGLSAGPEVLGKSLLSISASFGTAVNAPVWVGPIGNVLQSANYLGTVPYEFNLDGAVKLAGIIPLGSVAANFIILPSGMPLITLDGGLGPLGGKGCGANPTVAPECTPQGINISVGGFTIAGVNATVSAVLDGSHFDAEGQGSVTVLGLSLSGDALISTKGVAACADLFSFHASKDGTRDANSASAGTAPSSQASSLASQAFAASVVDNANPRALVALPASARSRKVRALEADLTALHRKVKLIETNAKVQAAAIRAAAARGTDPVQRTDMASIKRVGSSYKGGQSTQNDASGALLGAAVTASANLQAIGDTASDQLQDLQQTTNTEIQSLAQQAETDATELEVLHASGFAAADLGFGPLAYEANFWDDIGDWFEDAWHFVGSIFNDVWNGIKGIAADAAKDIGNAIVYVANQIGQLAGEALTAFENGMKVFVNDLAQLGTEAIDALKQFAVIVGNAIVKIADDVANLFDGEIGVGYDWGGTPTFYPTGGCSVGPYVDLPSLRPDSASDLRSAGAARRASAAAASTLHLTGGQQFVVLKFHGVAAPPLVDLSGQGVSLQTPTKSLAEVEDGGRAFVNRDPTSDSTFMMFQPTAGTYTVTLAPGSAAVASITKSDSLPAPSVTASVSGHGTRRRLHWSATPIPGQTLTFSVAGSGGNEVITSTSAAHGSAPFTIKPGLPGMATVSVVIDEDGFTREGFSVASFQAPALPAPARPRGLSISRSGTTVSAHWRPAGSGVTGYLVQVSTTGGLNETLQVTSPSVTLSGLVPMVAVSLEVTAVDSVGLRSKPAARTLTGRGASACAAPARVTVKLKSHGRLRDVVALLGHLPVAESRTGSQTLAVPLAGATGSRITLTVQAVTAAGKRVHASHVFALCSRRPVPSRLTLTLR